MSVNCFFDGDECLTSGACLECVRFPGAEEATAKVAQKTDPREPLVKARDITQLDPGQYVARVVLQWDEAIYGMGPSPEVALAMADYNFGEAYNFAVRFHEFMTK